MIYAAKMKYWGREEQFRLGAGYLKAQAAGEASGGTTAVTKMAVAKPLATDLPPNSATSGHRFLWKK